MKQVVIELPVCPKCHSVTMLTADYFNGQAWCVGPKDEPHKKVRKEKRRFRMLRRSGADS